MSGIFISYRRDDSAGSAGRLHDRLLAVWGADEVFMDVDNIGPGEDFRDAIDRTLQECDVILAVIGPQWLDADESGTRRIDSESDFVHIELRRALERDIRVIPILVDGAEMPTSEMLPEPLRPIAFRQAFDVTPHRFRRDVDLLNDALGRVATQLASEEQELEESGPTAADTSTVAAPHVSPSPEPAPEPASSVASDAEEMTTSDLADEQEELIGLLGPMPLVPDDQPVPHASVVEEVQRLREPLEAERELVRAEERVHSPPQVSDRRRLAIMGAAGAAGIAALALVLWPDGGEPPDDVDVVVLGTSTSAVGDDEPSTTSTSTSTIAPSTTGAAQVQSTTAPTTAAPTTRAPTTRAPTTAVPTTGSPSAAELIQIFFNNYEFEDLYGLAAAWGTPCCFEIKAEAGAILWDGNREALDEAIAGVRDGLYGGDVYQAFFDAGYDYDDAVVVAEEFGISEVWLAKIRVGLEVLGRLG